MIISAFRCEMCPATVDFPPGSLPIDAPMPGAWITLMYGRVVDAHDLHFCSNRCLRTWLTGQLTANDIPLTSRDWEKLSKEQQADVQRMRDDTCAYLIADTELFYQDHPELKLLWSFTLDAVIREVTP